MPVRSARFASLLALATSAACAGSGAPARSAPAPAAPRPFEYAASTGQYRLESSSKITQSAMGQSQDITTSSRRLMTISVTRPSPDTLVMTLVVDSFTTVGPMGMTPPGIDKVPGSRFTAKLSPFGAFYSATGPSESENQVAAGMTDEMGRALPRIRATLTAGVSWTDTVTDKLRQSGLDVSRHVITRYAVIGDSTVSGEPAWKIQRESNVTGTGTGTAQGQSVTLETSGTVKGHLWIAKRGVLIGGQSEEQSTGKVVLVSNGIEVALSSTTNTTVTKVK